MSINQQRRAAYFMGRDVKHFTGISGTCIGAVLGKKGKGLWLCVSNGERVWHQYHRCK